MAPCSAAAQLQSDPADWRQEETLLHLFITNLVAAGFLIPVFSLDLGFIAFCFCSSLAKSMKPSWFYLRISPERVWCEFLSNRPFFNFSSLYVLVSLMSFLQIFGEVSGRTTLRWRWRRVLFVWLNTSLMELFLRQSVTVAMLFIYSLIYFFFNESRKSHYVEMFISTEVCDRWMCRQLFHIIS